MNKYEQERLMAELKAQMDPNYGKVGFNKKNADASVIKRGIAGAVIGGPAGAVVGAVSALDENLRKK